MRLPAVLLVLAAQQAWAVTAVTSIEVKTPRPFGYVIGDTLTERVIVEAARPYVLAAGAVPKPGRVDQWLSLKESGTTTSVTRNGARYEITLTYQIINSPGEVKTIFLPQLALKLTGGDKPIQQTAPEWPFTIAPITPTYVLAHDGLEEMRPDAPPATLAATAYSLRVAFYAAIAGAISLYFAYAYFGLPFVARANGPFARAYRELARFSKRADAAAFRESLRRMHRAFDETGGKTCFAERLEDFLEDHPAFADLRADAERFFELSRAEFFGPGLPGDARSFSWLLDFCRACRERERGVA